MKAAQASTARRSPCVCVALSVVPHLDRPSFDCHAVRPRATPLILIIIVRPVCIAQIFPRLFDVVLRRFDDDDDDDLRILVIGDARQLAAATIFPASFFVSDRIDSTRRLDDLSPSSHSLIIELLLRLATTASS